VLLDKNVYFTKKANNVLQLETTIFFKGTRLI